MGADPTASHVTGGCSTVELQPQIYLIVCSIVSQKSSVSGVGYDPTTYGLWVHRSTNWATPTYFLE